jgi:ATP-dependent DNA helicase DinG
MPGGELRRQQVDMCKAVAVAMAGGRHLVVQAGTGTGKSLAYTVPAVVSGKRVVVATATKALQDQLADKDLPSVSAALGTAWTFAVLKGRNNYLCRQRAVEIGGRGFQQALADDVAIDGDAAVEDAAAGATTTGEATVDDAASATGAGSGGAGPADRLVDQVRRLLDWGEETTTGDRAELAFEPDPRAWAMLSVGPRDCPGAFRCPSGNNCFAERARAEAAEADIVVVNTHLYGAHLASGGAVLPPHDVVVFDEAHEVESVMTASLGAEITPGRFGSLATAARPLLRGSDAAGVVGDVTEVARRLQDSLEARVGTRVLRVPVAEDGKEPRAGRVRARAAPPPAGGREDDAELSNLLELSASRLQRLLASLRKADTESSGGDAGTTGATAGATAGDWRAGRAARVDRAGRIARALSAGSHLAEDLARLSRRSDDEVVWVDGSRRAPILRLSPIDVGPPLAAGLWGEVTAVLTSATIPPRLPERLGLSDFEVTILDVGSPFDYRTHALLYAARHLPDRRTPESEPALHDELEHLIRAAGGRTLALFTSHHATTTAAAALRGRLPYRLLAQGDLPKGRLLAEFAADEESCLFATLGFWQGVDVPGRSLSLVTLDRLPFARPDDPLLEARRERAGDAAFRLVDLPRAATLLAQGAGRLIRSADDYGVVAVLDPRLATASYRGVLLAGLPPMRRTTELRQAEEFLRRILAEHPSA